MIVVTIAATELKKSKNMLEDFKLKIFMAVAQQHSFTKAAADLGISQPAVSQNISELEKLAGVKLFERLRGEVILTPQGKIFQKYVSRILYSFEDLNMIFCNSRINNRNTPVRLFISPILSGLLSNSLHENLETIRPGLSVQIVDSPEAAHVSILDVTEKKDADLSIKVNVLSDDLLLAAFFRQLVEISI